MARSTTAAKAYSYLRFSTPEQMKGDSLRRQAEAAQLYCKEKGLVLDDSLSLHDLGVSAFRGSNAARKAALGKFLEAVESGVVTPGSYLLVENIDRLSRKEAWDAQSILQSIVNKGVTVVTLMDRQEYFLERMRREPWCFMQAYGAMIRAHEESATKSKRAKEAYRAAVQRARDGKGVVSAKHPGWLRYDKEAKTYEAIPERVKVVQRMFALAREGVGKDSIAETFNREEVPVFGSGKRWHGSFIFKTLNNRAVLGELHPGERNYTAEGRRERIALPVIKGYYPAVIGRKEFDRVATLAGASNNPRRGRHAHAPVSNVLGGLARCPKCGEAMTRVNKGSNGGVPYLVCVKAKTGAGCTYHVVNYRLIEAAFFEQTDQLVADLPPASNAEAVLQQQLKEAERDEDVVIEALERLTQVAEAGKTRGAPSAVRVRLDELEAERVRLAQDAADLRGKLANVGPSVVAHRIKELRRALAEPRDIGRANAALRLVLNSAEVDYRHGTLHLNWRHGGTSTLTYDAGVVFRSVRPGRKPKPQLPGSL